MWVGMKGILAKQEREADMGIATLRVQNGKNGYQLGGEKGSTSRA